MGKVLFGSHSGPRQFLSEKEEEELVVFLTHCATIGYPRSRKDVMNIVQATLVQKGHQNTLYGIHSGKGILIFPQLVQRLSRRVILTELHETACIVNYNVHDKLHP